MHEKRLATESNNGSLIFLSLFLLLLAFFILLNALATIEETKSRQVLTSVAATFRSVVDADTSAQVLLSELGPASEPDEILEAMEQLWVTAVSVTKVETLSAGQLMQITMPVNELFLGGKAGASERPKTVVGAGCTRPVGPGEIRGRRVGIGAGDAADRSREAGRRPFAGNPKGRCFWPVPCLKWARPRTR